MKRTRGCNPLFSLGADIVTVRYGAFGESAAAVRRFSPSYVEHVNEKKNIFSNYPGHWCIRRFRIYFEGVAHDPAGHNEA